MHDTYLERLEQAQMLSGNASIKEQAGEAAPEAAVLSTAREPIFSKGQSKRIWNEVRVQIWQFQDVMLISDSVAAIQGH